MRKFNLPIKRSLVQAPLPRFRDLFSAIFSSASGKDLAAPWLSCGDVAYWFSRSSWSMAAIVQCFQQFAQKQTVNVWLPDFFCNSALAPMRSLGANFVFYKVTDQLFPDLSHCNNLAEYHRLDLFCLVHYFGQAVPARSIASFCKQHQGWLIEDAAHVFLPVSGVGDFGDFVLFSPHKHLPVPDGAVMVVRLNGPAQFGKNEYLTQILAQVNSNLVLEHSNTNKNSIKWLLKRLVQRLGVRACVSSYSFNAQVNTFKSSSDHPGMSVLAKRLLIPLFSRFQEVVAYRGENAQTWSNVLRCFDILTPFIKCKSSSSPYLAGFSSGNAALTEVFFNSMQQAGLPVTTWPDLPPEVLLEAQTHSIAISLRNTSFFLPVHQTLTRCNILDCASLLLNSATTDWSIKQLSREEWDEYWKTCFMVNLYQSWQYGAAKETAEGWLPFRLLICDRFNCPIAIVQVLTKQIPFIGCIARINRGPIVLGNLPDSSRDVICLLVISLFLKYARSNRWRIIQIAPEIRKSSPVANDVLLSIGLHPLNSLGWASGLLDLDRDEHAIMMGLKPKWRNCMRKGQKNGVIVTKHNCNSDQLILLNHSYDKFQREKNFQGIPEKLISALSRQYGELWSFSLFIASKSDLPTLTSNDALGYLVLIRAGDTATYFISSVTDFGRKMQANSVLLWSAILHSKQIGCSWFDIGGLNENTTKGVADFKNGLNAVPYQNVQEWRKWL